MPKPRTRRASTTKTIKKATKTTTKKTTPKARSIKPKKATPAKAKAKSTKPAKKTNKTKASKAKVSRTTTSRSKVAPAGPSAASTGKTYWLRNDSGFLTSTLPASTPNATTAAFLLTSRRGQSNISKLASRMSGPGFAGKPGNRVGIGAGTFDRPGRFNPFPNAPTLHPGQGNPAYADKVRNGFLTIAHSSRKSA